MNDKSATEPVSIRRRQFLGLTAASGVGLALGTGVSVANAASAQAATPTIYSTEDWNAVPPSSPVQVLTQRPIKLFIHHTATPNSTDFSLSHGFAFARSVQTYHMQTRGWIDSGQQFTLDRGGHAIEGRHRSLEVLRAGTGHVLGAHCTAQNSVAVGIEVEGTYNTVAPPDHQYAALVELSVYICRQFGIRAYQIYGHRNFNTTDCPGDIFYAMLPELRAEIAGRIGGDPTPPAWPTVRLGDRGETVRAMQYVLRWRGATITADGNFGSGTEAAVRAFQTDVHASSDGIVGPQTWNQLAEQQSRGASNEAVKAVQNQLVVNGITIGSVDGAFGSKTEAGVKTFQTRVGLTADGIADQRTLSHLLA